MRPLGPDPVPNPFGASAWREPTMARRSGRFPVLHVVLFLLTLLTTTIAGAFQAGADPIADPSSLTAGVPFSATLLSILLVHEFGHFTLAKWHGVRASLPYFIPAPPVFIGTFGAFIRMQSPPPNRRALFDVGAAGPWAGFVLAVPAVFIGLQLSEVRPLGLSEGGLELGDSLLFSWLTRLAIGTTADQATIVLHPVALAGWFGLFVTFLNLLPVGQLDGGHVSYALLGRWHATIARVFIAVIAVLGLRGWQGWYMWVILLLLIGVDHPRTADAATPLDGRRRLAAMATVALFVVTFMANPIAVVEPAPTFSGERTPVVWRSPGGARPRPRLVVPSLRPDNPRKGAV